VGVLPVLYDKYKYGVLVVLRYWEIHLFGAR